MELALAIGHAVYLFAALVVPPALLLYFGLRYRNTLNELQLVWESYSGEIEEKSNQPSVQLSNLQKKLGIPVVLFYILVSIIIAICFGLLLHVLLFLSNLTWGSTSPFLVILFIIISVTSVFSGMELLFFHFELSHLYKTRVVLSLLIGVLWFVFPSWITYDLVFVFGCFGFLYRFPVFPLRFILCLLIFLMFYDIWGVFLSGKIIELAVGTGKTGSPPLIPPLLWIVPYNPFCFSLSPFIAIGFGDILIPGMAMIAAYEVRLHIPVLVGFIIGAIAAIILSAILAQGVPALITICPAIFLCLGLSYLRRRFHK